MRTTIFTILFALLFVSCKPTLAIQNKELLPLENNALQEYTPYETVTDSTSALLEVFNINEKVSSQVIKLQVLDNKTLKISFKNKLGVEESRMFKGKMKPNYFKLFVQKERLFILPIIWTKDVKRLKLSRTNEIDLVINEYSNHSGMLVFMAAGNSWKKQYFFKKLE